MQRVPRVPRGRNKGAEARRARRDAAEWGGARSVSAPRRRRQRLNARPATSAQGPMAEHVCVRAGCVCVRVVCACGLRVCEWVVHACGAETVGGPFRAGGGTKVECGCGCGCKCGGGAGEGEGAGEAPAPPLSAPCRAAGWRSPTPSTPWSRPSPPTPTRPSNPSWQGTRRARGGANL